MKEIKHSMRSRVGGYSESIFLSDPCLVAVCFLNSDTRDDEFLKLISITMCVCVCAVLSGTTSVFPSSSCQHFQSWRVMMCWGDIRQNGYKDTHLDWNYEEKTRL